MHWSPYTTFLRMTPRRISCLLMIHQFGTIAVTVQYGWQTHWKVYTVHSLNVLLDSTAIALWLRKEGLLKRTYPGSMNYELSSRGLEMVRYLESLG